MEQPNEFLNKQEQKKSVSKSNDSKELVPFIKDIVSDIDYAVMTKLQAWRTKFGTYFWKTWSFCGYPFVWLTVGIICAFLDLFHVLYVISFAECSSLIAVFPIKNHYRRERPFKRYKTLSPLTNEKNFSFPSGHAYNATVNGVALALCYGGLISLGLMIGLAILVAVSRVYLGVHYPSDVAMAFVFGLIVAFIISLCFPLILILNDLTLLI